MCCTEYLNYEDQKFSKSRNTGVFGDSVLEIGIPADVWRFYLIYMRPENQDTAFSWDDFTIKVKFLFEINIKTCFKINSELLSNLGNFILRALTFLQNSFDGVQPKIELTEHEENLFDAINKELSDYHNCLERIKLREALIKILAISRLGNQYMQSNQPWVLSKGSDQDK